MPFLVKPFFTINYIPFIIISNTSHMQNPSEVITEIRSHFPCVLVLARAQRLFYTTSRHCWSRNGKRKGECRSSAWFGSLSGGTEVGSAIPEPRHCALQYTARSRLETAEQSWIQPVEVLVEYTEEQVGNRLLLHKESTIYHKDII